MTRVVNQNLQSVFGSERKDKMLGLRVTAAEHRAVSEAAQSVNESISGYLLKLHRFAIGGDQAGRNQKTGTRRESR